MIIALVCLRLATIKGHSKMCSFITQHNATDVASFEGTCNWHADCRNVHQSCSPRRAVARELNVHFSTIPYPSPKAFQRIGRTSSRPHNRRPCVATPAQDLHIQHLHLQDRLRPATRTAAATIGLHNQKILHKLAFMHLADAFIQVTYSAFRLHIYKKKITVRVFPGNGTYNLLRY